MAGIKEFRKDEESRFSYHVPRGIRDIVDYLKGVRQKPQKAQKANVVGVHPLGKPQEYMKGTSIPINDPEPLHPNYKTSGIQQVEFPKSSGIRNITRNPALQAKQDGTLERIVPDKPQMPPAQQPLNPVQRQPLNPGQQQRVDNTIAGQNSWNAMNPNKEQLGYQDIPDGTGNSILRRGMGMSAPDTDPTPLADREPMQMIRGTDGSYSNQASPLTEYATRSEAQKQEFAPITAARDTQERDLAGKMDEQTLKNRGLFDVAKERSRGDLATQKEYNKRPSTKAEKDASYTKVSDAYTKAMDPNNPNPITAAQILLDLEAKGDVGAKRMQKMLMAMDDEDSGFQDKVIEILRNSKE